MRAFVKIQRHDRSSGLVDNISDAVAIVRMNGCYLSTRLRASTSNFVQRTNFGGIGMNFGFLDTYHPKKIG